MAEYRKVALEDIPTAPVHLEIDLPLRAPRERVWALLADPATWGDWCPGFDKSGHWVTRTPEGVGSVRAVRAGGLRFRESILAHDEGRRWAFRVDAGVPAMAALAEDYRLDDAPDGCVLHWSGGFWPRGPLRLAKPLIAPGARTFVGMLARGLERAAAGTAV
jgi:hypothetical protein